MIRTMFDLIKFFSITGTLTFSFFTFAPQVEAKASFDSLRTLVASGQLPAALKELESIQFKKLKPDQQRLYKFAEGILLFENQNWAGAQKVFEEFLQTPSDLSAYVSFYLGLCLRNQNKMDEAEVILTRVLKLKPPQIINYQTRFILSEIHIAQKKWATAFKHLYFLERRWRSNPQHADVLWRLVATDLNTKKRWRACRWAQKLYSEHPANPLVYDWGIDLQNAMVDGQKIGCQASLKDQQRRLRRLQWAGESERARKEIEELRKRTTAPTRYLIETLYANFLINEGFVEEALQALIPFYEERVHDVDYLMLFARAAARSGEYHSASKAYLRVHSLAPKSSTGQQALFQSAFLSYQFQDYDGALRKFQDFITLYPKSTQSFDSRWHLAWIKYLRADYDGAFLDLGQLNGLQKRNRLLRRKYPSDRIQYWQAMSLLRINKTKEARRMFDQLIEQDPYGYYAIASKARIQHLPKVDPSVRDLAAEKPQDELASRPLALQVDGATPLLSPGDTVLPSEGPDAVDVLAAGDSGETDEPVEAASEPSSEDVEIPVAENEKDEDDRPENTGDFSSPVLQARFDRAKRLMDLGFYEWARWELFEIEKRTHNQTYLRMLMSAYESISSFNRSSYVSETYFGRQRILGGIKKEKELWRFAYPQAFEEPIARYTKEFGIAREIVWSIMRAESAFKADVTSPVGARGLMQIMPNTSRQLARLLSDESFQVEQLIRPDVNIRLGSRYLARLSQQFKERLPLIAAGYNAGPHKVEGWLVSFGHLEMDEFIDHIPYLETRNYVKKVIRNFDIYKQLYASSADPLKWLGEPIGVVPPQRAPTRENWETL